jgi:RNA recognition motif-containing protein
MLKEYEDYHNAKSAIKEMDGFKMDGRRIVVEQAGEPGRMRRSGPQEDDKCFKCGKRGHW